MATHVIDAAIEVITAEINNYFLATSGNEVVIPANLLTQTGSLTQGLDGKVVLSLVNIEEDRLSRPLNIHRKRSDGTVETIKPEVRLNLYLLFITSPTTTNSNGSGEAFLTSLGKLSQVIGFFQSKNFFDHQNSPALDPRIEQLWMEMYPMTFEQQNHLWGALGAKYMPSILYRARLVRIQEEQLQADGPPISTINLSGNDHRR